MSKINKFSKKGNFREYRAWQAMKDRCLNPHNVGYPNYGGRGIQVHQTWKDSFDQFRQDMGPCPEGWTLDRINNSGNYEPTNCRWATRETQGNNKRTNRKITLDGKAKTASQWEKELNIGHGTVTDRYRRGVTTIKDMLNPPAEVNRNLTLLTLTEKTNNERLNLHVGETKPIVQWATLMGMNPVTLTARLRNGLNLKEALTKPVGWSRRPKRERCRKVQRQLPI